MASPFLSGDAQWIWAPNYDDNVDPGRFVLLRKSFQLQQVPSEDVLLHVSADTRYRLYLNGQSVSFGPAKSYPGRWNYETVNVTPFLKQGDNVLAARVLRMSPTQHGCLSMTRTPLPGLIVLCSIDGQNLNTGDSWKAKIDESVALIGDNEWDFRLGPCFLSLNERVDGRASVIGWLESGYDDASWSTAAIITYRRKMSPMLEFPRLVPREIPAMTETPRSFEGVVTSTGNTTDDEWAKLLQGQTVDIPADSTVSVDIEAATLTTGFLDIACSSDGQTQHATVQILYSECYESPMEEGKPRNKGDRADYKNGQLYGMSDFYTVRNGPNHYSPFWFRAFRYIRLTITTGDAPVTISSLSYRKTHYPLDIQSSISTPNQFISKLWDISVATLQNCMHETYEDCPFYEQQQFAMDSRSQILFTYLLSRDDRLARKAIHEFYASRRDDGLVATNFPSPGRATNIPTFSLFWVLMVYDHMVYFGDEKLVKTYIGAIDGVLDYFDQHINEIGLVGQFEPDCWGFVDWINGWFTPGKGFMGLAIPKAYYSKGAATYHSLLYAYTLLKASELCTFLGRRDTAEEYLARHKAIVRAVQAHCFDASSGLYLDGPGTTDELSQHTQIFAILTGCVEGSAASDLMKRTVLETGTMAKASFAMSFYAFRAASTAGVYEECWPELIKPWEKMISQNLTTWAESESMSRSDCHGWSASPLYEIGTEILGVRYRSEAYLQKLGLGGSPIQVAPKTSLVGEISGKLCIRGTSDGGPPGCLSVEWQVEGKPNVSSTVEAKVQVLGAGTS